MKPHYAGSIAFDNEQGEWEDRLMMAYDFDDLCKDMKSFTSRRKNSEVHFAAYVDRNGREHDITQKVKEVIG
tara:strand:- start:289 stop:504 length:216 start_codon:yes stop_codon:yes gene_type:complete